MRDVLETALGYAVLVGIVAAVVLGMRRGKANRAAAIASAHASGYAEGGKAAAAAHAHQAVNVAVDNSRHGDPPTLALWKEHNCDDPRTCAVCAPVIACILGRSVGVTALDDGTRRYYDDDRGHDDNRALHDGTSGNDFAGIYDATDAPVPIERGRNHPTRTDHGVAGGGGAGDGRVRGPATGRR